MHIVFVDSNIVGLNALKVAKSMGHDVTFICSERFAPLIAQALPPFKADFIDRLISISDSLDPQELLQALRIVNAEAKIDALLTVLEFCVLPVALCAEELGLPGSPPTAISLCQDKNSCREAIEAAGLRSVPHMAENNFEQAKAFANSVGYPLIAKPRKGAGSIFAARIDDEEQLQRYYMGQRDLASHFIGAVSEDVLLEKYIMGPLFSVELAAAGDEYSAMMISARKRCDTNPSIELGTTMPAPVDADVATALSNYAIEVVKNTGLTTGIFHIEVILSAEGPILVEVNPRIMGGNMPTLFRRATGIDPYALLIEIFTANKLPVEAKKVIANQAAATRMIGFEESGIINAELSTGWDAALRSRTVAWSFDITAGQKIDLMENSFHPHFFQVLRPTGAEASLLSEWIVSGISKATGLKLRRSSEDYLE